jgi:hypothetical protein
MILAVATAGIGLLAGLALPISRKEEEVAGRVAEPLVGAALAKGTEAIRESGAQDAPSETPSQAEGERYEP